MLINIKGINVYMCPAGSHISSTKFEMKIMLFYATNAILIIKLRRHLDLLVSTSHNKTPFFQ
jgi:hypothetical protein